MTPVSCSQAAPLSPDSQVPVHLSHFLLNTGHAFTFWQLSSQNTIQLIYVMLTAWRLHVVWDGCVGTRVATERVSTVPECVDVDISTECVDIVDISTAGVRVTA